MLANAILQGWKNQITYKVHAKKNKAKKKTNPSHSIHFPNGKDGAKNKHANINTNYSSPSSIAMQGWANPTSFACNGWKISKNNKCEPSHYSLPKEEMRQTLKSK